MGLETKGLGLIIYYYINRNIKAFYRLRIQSEVCNWVFLYNFCHCFYPQVLKKEKQEQNGVCTFIFLPILLMAKKGICGMTLDEKALESGA